jgi:exosortase/archaeosortase family protein
MTFFALSAAVALVIGRPALDRTVVFLSAVPVGVLMNVVRVTVTVLLYEATSAELAEVVFHDLAGWIMMPLALLVLWLELLFLGRLRLPTERTRPVPLPVLPPRPPRSTAAVPAGAPSARAPQARSASEVGSLAAKAAGPEKLSRPEATAVPVRGDRPPTNAGRLLLDRATANGSL